MSRELTVLRNSLFLTVQPVLMNVVSVFVTGYMARVLGPSDFGMFNFVLSFTMLFYPIAILGLNRVSVREMAGL
jgi:O-antigen/teichoic acid export membrane protein